ncbi:MAG: DUF481 domain-containing protein [Elusimicrobia bacterium]|nr:DUF481 domain-containing protein [Elusimicrobiota bacterium]
MIRATMILTTILALSVRHGLAQSVPPPPSPKPFAELLRALEPMRYDAGHAALKNMADGAAEASGELQAARYLAYALVRYETEHRTVEKLLEGLDPDRRLYGIYIFLAPAEQVDVPASSSRQPKKEIGKAVALTLDRVPGFLSDGGSFDGSLKEEEKGFEHETSVWSGATGHRFDHAGFGLQHETIYREGPWEAGVEARYLRGFDQHGVPAVEYGGELHLKRDIAPGRPDYLHAEQEWIRDEFVGLEQKIEARAGYGYRFFKDELHELEAAVGMGWVREDAKGSHENFPSPAVELEYVLKPLPGLRLSQKISVDANLYNPRDWDIRGFTEAAYELSERVTLKLVYALKIRTEPTEGFDRDQHRIMLGFELKY